MTATATTALPAVASRMYTDCKKCGVERFHIVLAHPTAASAKIECEVCHAKRTFKLESPKKKKTGVKKTRVPSASTRWEEVSKHLDEKSKQPYNMKAAFSLNSTIDHPKFGLGVVTAIVGQSMEVVFIDATRSLVHNRV
jgi:hypothetical protein